jgi:hypothetical protein
MTISAHCAMATVVIAWRHVQMLPRNAAKECCQGMLPRNAAKDQ